MENHIISSQESTTMWKWYFGWHPRVFLTVPIFLLFVWQGFWLIFAEISDVIFFFQNAEVTWGRIFLIMFLGTFLVWFLVAPIIISFWSIYWLYQVNVEQYTAWRKFLYSIGIVLLVLFGTSIIRLFTAWILGILG